MHSKRASINTKERLHKILYVEDEADIREITQIALVQIAGFDVCVCESGITALEKAKDFQPDLIILDVMMPGMDGPETMINLKQITELSSVPCIFMTAKVQTDEVNHLLSLGAIGVIPKPFDPIQLPNQLTDIWNKQT